MDGNNWRTAQGQVQIPGQVNGSEAGNAAGMEGVDWRTQLQPDSRQRIVNKIMETLKRHLPLPGPDGLQELKKIAVRFEARIYAAATSQSDYLRKISFKMETMETMANSLQSSAASTSKNSQKTGSADLRTRKQYTNWRIAQGQVHIPGQVNASESGNAAGMEGFNWRTQLQPDSRQRIVNKIMETLKRHLPLPGPDELQELKKIAVRFEAKIHAAATSQSDYLRKISLKMLTMETRSQNPMANSLQSSAASTSKNSQETGSADLPTRKQYTNWQTAQGQVHIPGQVNGIEAGNAAGMEGVDWRTQLQPDSRQRIVNKIMQTLKRHLPLPGRQGLQELKKIAVRFEAKIYAAATSQSDYLRKISLKMLTMETRSQNPMANSLQSSAANTSKNSQETASQNMQSQIQNQMQQQPVPMISNQSQVRQQLISQNIQNNIASVGEMVSELSIE